MSDPSMSTMSDPELTVTTNHGLTSEGVVSETDPKVVQTAGSGLDHSSDKKQQEPVLVSSGCQIMDERSVLVREYRVEEAYKELDDRFNNAIRESELYLEELKKTLPVAVDLKMNTSSPYTPEGRLMVRRIHEVESLISGLEDARKVVMAVYLGRLSLLDARRPYREAQLERIRDLSTLSKLSRELVDLRASSLRSMKSSMICLLGKLRKELRSFYSHREDLNTEKNEENSPYSAFLVDNCEVAARSLMLACANTGWGNLIGAKLQKEVKLTQSRAAKFYEEMRDWWEQLQEEAQVMPAQDLEETMDGLGKVMSLATAVREKMLENIKTSRVLAEEDREPSECILEKNLEEENRDDDIVENLRRTLDSYREKMREDKFREDKFVEGKFREGKFN